MAKVTFTVMQDFASVPSDVWRALIDWKGHEDWVPMTRVIVDPGDPHAIGATFTAWTGPWKLALKDRMRVAELDWSDADRRGSCAVDKLGPVLRGRAGFTVQPLSDRAGAASTSDASGPSGAPGPTDGSGVSGASGASGAPGARMVWFEDVTVPYVPQLLSPIITRLAAAGFRGGMRRLAKQLDAPAPASAKS